MTDQELYLEVPLAPSAIEESRAYAESLDAAGAGDPPVYLLPVAEARAARAAGLGPNGAAPASPRAKSETIPGPGGPIGLRLFVPERPVGLYLHLHGGGWVFGSAADQDPLLEEISERAEVVVASVEYRLAPEHRFPAARDDALAAARQVVSGLGERFGCEAFAIGGESAGAHLALLAAMALRDEGEAGSLVALNLAYGVFDLSLSPSARAYGSRGVRLSTPMMRWYVEQFLGDQLGRAAEPEISPLYGELSGLPAALVSVGSDDLLVDDSCFLATRLRLAGNAGHLELYEGAGHGFSRQPTELGAISRQRQIAFLAESFRRHRDR